ncbi:MAG TPA: EAL domain-containing protein [Steroidobacteraceae bacterium]|nr:EAL domain-containing protein [Steroidobacteraceae bacterium]
MGGLLHNEDSPTGAPSLPAAAATWQPWLEATEIFIGILDAEGRLLMGNAPALAAAGLLPQEVVGRHFSEIATLTAVPDAGARVRQLFEQAIEGNVVRAEVTLRLRDNRLTAAACLVMPLRDASGRVAEIAVAAVPVGPERGPGAGLLSLNRELRMVSSCMRVLIRAQDEATLLNEVCHIIVESGGYLLAWVGFAEEDPERSIRPIAHMGVDRGYLEEARISWAPNERGLGPTGRAVRERTTQICSDVQTDPAFALWRGEAHRRGFRSSIALPLIAGDACLGALSIYSERVDAFDQPEVRLLEELAGELAYGIGALRARAEREQARQSVLRFRSLLDESRDLIYICDPQTGNILDANEAMSRLLGYTRGELLTMTVADFSLTAAEAPWAERIKHLRDAGGALVVAARYRGKSAQIIDVETSLRYVQHDERPYVVAVTRDITERVQQQERIARLARILRMQSSVNSAVLRIRDRDELLREASRVAVDVGGYDRAVFVLVDADGRRARPQFRAGAAHDFPEPAEILIGDGTEPDTSLSSRALRTGEVTVCSDLTRSEPPVALREQLIALGYKSMVALPLVVEGRRVGVLVLTSKKPDLVRDEELLLLQDMMASLSAALRSQEQAIAAQFLAYFDQLTGLAKRALFCERLENVLRWRAEPLDSLSVTVFDIHHLSLINDSFGRHFGDLALQRVAERLKLQAGADEQLGYLGGGTFAIIDPHFGRVEGAVSAALDEVSGAPFAIEGRSLRLSFRSGVARYPADATDADTLVQRAEAALKEAKEVGEPYVHYRLEMHSELAERLELEHRLRTALDEQQFQLHYQPQLNFATGEIESVEALLRWDDPELGMLPPGRFLPVLEATGLIIPVGAWAIGRIVEDCQHWARLGIPPVRVAVNVSALQLRRKTFVPTVLGMIQPLAALPGWGLDLEITESVVLHDLKTTSRKLAELRAAGLRIALDDFGTGYSALGLLPKLPVDVVKIDRSFISGLPDDAPSTLLVDSIIRLASSLKLLTVAEGVETQAQLAALRGMKCGGWQGHLYSAAVPREKLEQLLSDRGRLPPEVG